ncbi:aldo/keto reductase [Actinokineospora spheciospongiae]|uniref:aldo/keto reductase n=1 Tax=Actinokineospora spheciospongiae TaxID=909613 RepID=UPI000D715C6C|nr:aldo/keto reductase [Actinokineospora spheciospongiae]PWW64485.1 aryl-alcohol dehydrogenase-like predicted oxidoreductase [Actinokineospora spheciospongiae]
MTLPTRHLGALEVSAQGLGCMGMSHGYGGGDDVESTATIHAALDAGVTLLDTADAYANGVNEELVGKAVEGRRDQVVLATKFGIVSTDAAKGLAVRGDRDHVRACCEASLRRLGVDHIDLYYQHRVDPEVPIEDTIGAMAELVAEGKVRHLGMSEAGAATIRRAAAVHPIAALQSEWSLWTRGIEDEVLGTCRELGIGVVPFSPLGRGFLTGRVTRAEYGAGDMRAALPRFTGENFDRNLAIVRALEELARERGVTAGQLALAWVQSRGEDVVPIPGTKRRTYLAENVAAATLELSTDDVAAIEAAAPADAVAGERYTAAMQNAVGH